MRLIDCQDFALIDRQDDMAYLALSYVWGLANEDLVALVAPEDGEPDDNRHSRRLPTRVPRVVSDAMTVTTDLGYRYLWVDQFCIDQKADAAVLVNLISQMDLIYMSAQLTIIAASTSGALPGVGDTPRTQQKLLSIPPPGAPGSSDDAGGFTIFTTSPHVYESVKKSVWYQRGWCFQESVLSPARLYFTDHETLFQTHSSAFSE
ncbi:heterokaryon incompatibility protein-domain-containing protein, partial [Microdochium trichocladiopsis]